MSGFLKATTVALVIGLTCFCGLEKAAATAQEGEEEGESGEVPLYYLQLQGFAAARSRDEEALKPQLLEYIVEPMDCLYTIAACFGTDVDTLVRLNNITNPHLIYPGEKLEILTVVGCVHDVEEGDTVAAIAAAYGVDEEAIVQANDLSAPPVLFRGERIIVPGGISSRGSQRLAFCWPLQGRLSSGYGWRNGKFHYGIDIAAAYGTPFYASAGGRVTHAGYLGNYGIMVEVDHGGGYLTRYAHACRTAVGVGQQVSPGEALGFIGLTGNTTGPHLHFEIYVNGEKLNPLHFLE